METAREELVDNEADNEESVEESKVIESVIETNKEARAWAAVCHLSALLMLIGVPFGNILGPLIIWLIKRNEYVFVNDQGKSALNFQITLTLCIFALVSSIFLLSVADRNLGGTGILTISIFLIVLGAGIMGIICTVIAAMKSIEGIYYRYPLAFEFIK